MTNLKCEYNLKHDEATHVYLWGCPKCDTINELYICRHHYDRLIKREQPKCPLLANGPPCGTILEILHGPLQNVT